jgi:zinc protease
MRRASASPSARILLTAVALCLAAAAAPAQRINLPPVTRHRLKNGIQLMLMEYRRAPTLSVEALFPGGASGDPVEKAGVAAMTADLLKRGTSSRTAIQIAEEIDFLGGSLNAGAGDDSLTVSLSVLSKDADAGLNLLADVIRRSVFPPEEIERERQLALAGLQSLPDSPEETATRVATETVFRGHPYGVFRTIASVKRITRDDLLRYYQRFIVPDRLTIIAVGSFQIPQMIEKLRARFEDWTPSGSAAPTVAEARPTPRQLVLIDKPDATQTQVRLIRPAFRRNHPDFFAAELADAMLGGGFTSRLVDEIRVNRSLTYGIGSRFRLHKYGGFLAISTFTRIETTRAMLDALNGVLKRTAERGFTSEELQKVKSYLAGMFALGLQTPDALADILSDIALYNLPADYLQTYLTRLLAVPLTEVNRIARAYCRPESFSVVLVTPAAKISGQLKGLGRFETRPITAVGK